MALDIFWTRLPESYPGTPSGDLKCSKGPGFPHPQALWADLPRLAGTPCHSPAHLHQHQLTVSTPQLKAATCIRQEKAAAVLWQSDDSAWGDVVFVPREWGGGKTPFNKNKPSSKSENKMGSVPSILFCWCINNFWRAQRIKRPTEVAERFDHAVKPSRWFSIWNWNSSSCRSILILAGGQVEGAWRHILFLSYCILSYLMPSHFIDFIGILSLGPAFYSLPNA